jgi:hypothetical protein
MPAQKWLQKISSLHAAVIRVDLEYSKYASSYLERLHGLDTIYTDFPTMGSIPSKHLHIAIAMINTHSSNTWALSIRIWFYDYHDWLQNFFVIFQLDPRAWSMLGKYSTTELLP